MPENRLHLLNEHRKAVFNTGESEADFRSRLIFGLSAFFLALNLALITAEVAEGRSSMIPLFLITPVGAVVAFWQLLAKRNINLAASSLLACLFISISLVLLMSGGTLISGYVTYPIVVLLASVLCTRQVAVCFVLAMMAVIGGTVWLESRDIAFPLQLERSSVWELGRYAIISSVVTIVTLFLYRNSAEYVRKRAVSMQEKLAVTNDELSSVLSSQLASARLMFKVQEIGDLVGWWYEPKTGLVHYTATENREFRSFDVNRQGNKLDIQPLLKVDIRDLVLDRIDAAHAWDDETKIDRGDGELSWYRDSGEVEMEDGAVVRVVGVLQDITSSKALTDQLELHANYDELTGLSNRRIFWKAVSAEHTAYSENQEMSHLLFMDLDQFKLVNDTSGHVAGDRLLQMVARVLRENVQSTDVIGRVGGDEFGIIIRNCPRSTVAKVANRIRAAIEQIHFHWNGETFRVGASVGAIGIDPRNGSAEELHQLVDAACYEAKLSGRNRVNFFESDEEVISAHRGEARWVQRLRDAITHNRFELHGQLVKPVADTGEPDRYEVLIRLREMGSDRLIPPGAFLPAAERFGLSPEIDQWVIESLLQKLHADPDISKLQRRYWVNLSGNSIGDPLFAEYLIATMSSSTLPKGMVNFEITETAVIRNIEGASQLISKLRSMGCQFALDDFGSGLSSFGYLKKLPVDCLKIDGMFVREILNDEADRVFVQAIISIAQSMGIKTVAEFVENEEIYELVESFGVDYVQGYGVHRPEKLKFHEDQQTIGGQRKEAG